MNDNALYNSLLAISQDRRSTRSFKSDRIPAGDIEKIIGIAKTSPYAGGRKDWDIIVLDDVKKIRTLRDIVKEKSESAISGAKPDFIQMFNDYIRYFYSFDTAPVLLIPVYKYKSGLIHAFEPGNERIIELDHEGVIKSIACVSMMAILAAESLGYNTCFVHGACIASDEIVAELNLNRKFRIGAIIPVGYAAEEL